MARSMYSLLTMSPPSGPGPIAIYYPPPVEIVNVQGDPVLDVEGNPTYQDPPDIPQTAQSSFNAQFKRVKNCYDSYLNIRRAVFNILDDNIDHAFKVSNNPILVGWNLSMKPREMFVQITATYSPNNAPEVLFWRIEDCQKVQILGENPYTALLNNAVRLLLQCGLYTRDFEDWDQKPSGNRIWISLKTSVQECYTRQLNASSITSGAHRCVHQEESKEKDDDVETVIT